MRIDDAYFEDLLFHTEPLEAVTALDQFWSPRLDRAKALWGLAKPEHHVHLVVIYTGEVGNGGHAQFFMNRGGEMARQTIDVLREMELTDLEHCLVEACEIFPSGGVPDESSDIVRALSELPAAGLLRLEEMDQKLTSLGDTDAKLLDYLRKHRDEILRPERGLTEK